MKIAICDDELSFRNQLTEYLERYYKSLDLLISAFSDGETLLKKYIANSNAYDLVFLDIEMDKLDGIETAKKLREYNRDCIIIFLTSHVEMATEGYEVNAFRFLTKPMSENKLVKALQDVQNEWDRNKRLLIRDFDKEILLRYRDIVYIEAQNVNVLIRTMNESYSIRRTLTQIEEEVKGPAFYRCHRSYIINLGYVQDYDNKTITMDTGEKITLSRNKLAEFKQAIMLYVKNCGR